MSYLKKVESQREASREVNRRRVAKIAKDRESNRLWREAGGHLPKKAETYYGGYRELDPAGEAMGPWRCKRCKEPLQKRGFLSRLFSGKSGHDKIVGINAMVAMPQICRFRKFVSHFGQLASPKIDQAKSQLKLNKSNQTAERPTPRGTSFKLNVTEM